MNERVYELLKTIAEAATENPKAVEGIFGKIVVDEARSILKTVNEEWGFKNLEVVELSANYTIDVSDPEQVKYEGLQELRLFESIGKDILSKGAFTKNSDTESERHIHMYKVKVLVEKSK